MKKNFKNLGSEILDVVDVVSLGLSLYSGSIKSHSGST